MVSTPVTPSSIKHYEIIKQISEGGFGKAFIVRDTHISAPAECRRVIKQLKPIENDPQTYQLVQERFRQEAKTIEELGKGNAQVPTLYAYFEDQGKFYLVEEYIEGDTLAQVVEKQGPLEESQVKEILLKLAEVLDYIQSKRIIHRDIKPENIILRKSDGLPVLIDFGAVKESMGTTVTTSGHTSRSIVIGTPGFMATEQSSGRPVYASDIYALGLTAIYLLTGKYPEELENNPLTGEILWQDKASQVSPALVQVLEQATRPHFRERFLTAKEMLKALIEPASPPPSSPQPTTLSPAGNTVSPPPTTASYAPPSSPSYSNNPSPTSPSLQTVTILLSILVGMLGMLTAGGLLYFQPWKTQQTGNGSPSPEATTSPQSSSQPSPANTEQLEQRNAQLEAENQRIEAEINRKREEASRPIPSNSSLPYRSSCGSPAGSGSVWYGVVGDRGALSTVKSNYCGDAISVGGNTQAASFTSRSEAQEFANALTQATGYNFWVKEPKSVSPPFVSPPRSSTSLSYRSTCGSPAGSGSVWYAVVGDRGALSTVKSKYCGDAILVGGNVQAASFTSRSQAQQFANALSSATGYNFWVK